MKARIRGVQSHMKMFEFLYGLILSETLLSNADNRNLKDSVAMKTVKTLSSLRTDDNSDLFCGK